MFLTVFGIRTGERRIKNVVCVLEYVPDETQLRRVKTGDSIKEISHVDFLREFVSEADLPEAVDSASPEEDVRRTLSRGQEVSSIKPRSW